MQSTVISLTQWSLLTAIVMNCVVGYFILKGRSREGMPGLGFLLAGAVIWDLAAALTSISASPLVIHWAIKVEYLAAAVAATSMLAFSLQYSGRWKLNPHFQIALLAFPLFSQVALILSNPGHQLLWQTGTPPLTSPGTPGPLLPALYAINALMTWAGAALLMHTALTCSPMYRWQARLALAGISFPLLASFLEFLFCQTVHRPCYLLPLMITGTVFLWYFASFRLHVPRYQKKQEFDLLQTLDDSILILNNKGNVVYFNPAFQTRFGFSWPKILGKPAADMIPELQDLLSSFCTPDPPMREIARGEYHYQVKVQDFINIAGECEGRFIIFVDITKRWLAEMAIKSKELKYREIVEYQSDLITVWQLDTTLDFVNEAYCRYFEKPAEELIGRPFLPDRLPETQAVIQNAINRLVAGEESVLTEELSYSLDHEKRWTQWTYLPIKENDRLVAIQSVGRDITDQIRAEQAERTAREIAETLRSIGTELTRTLDTEKIMNKMLDLIAPIIPFDSANFLVVEGDLAIAARGRGYDQYGPLAVASANSVTFKIDEVENLRWMIENKQALQVSNVQQDHNWIPIAGLEMIQSWIGAPVFVNDTIFGFFSLDSSRPNQYTDDHIRYLNIFARQIGMALENAQLFETAQQRAREAETLREVAMTVNLSLTQEEIFALILEQLERVVPYDSAAILLKDENGTHIVGGRGFKDLNAVLGIHFPNDETTPNTAVVETKKTIIIEDAPLEYKEFSKPPHRGIRGWLGVPLTIQDKVIGLLAVDSKKTGNFNEEHARLAAAFASQVAMTIENARLFKEIQRLSITDPLTGSYNRRYFFDQAAREKDRSKRFDRPLAIILLDLDHFKLVNDRYGHRVGDQVLVSLVQSIQTQLRTMDILGRYGGEEFAVLLPETAAEEAKTAAERIRAIIEKQLIETEKVDLHITASLGVVVHDPQEEITIDELIDRADRAMYAAKRAGRNQVHLWKHTD